MPSPPPSSASGPTTTRKDSITMASKITNNNNNNNTVPSDICQALTIAKYELLNYRRSRRFVLMLAFVLGGSFIGSALIAYYHPSSFLSSPEKFLSSWIKYSVLPIVTLPASLLGGETLSREFQNKTGYSMFGNPVKRSILWLGKVIATFSVSLLMLCIVEIIEAGNVISYFGLGAISLLSFWESFCFTSVAIAGAIGLAFLFSSIFKNGAISILFSVFLLLIGFDLVTNIFVLANAEPWPLFNYGTQIIHTIFWSPQPPHMVNFQENIQSAPGVPNVKSKMVYYATVPEGLAIMTSYSVIGLAGSLVIFRTRTLN